MLDRTGGRAELLQDDLRLQKAVHAAARVTSGAAGEGDFDDHLRIRRPSGRKAYVAIVSPLGLNRIALRARQPAVLLFVTDPEQVPRLDQGALAKLFGFTPSEARLVSLLATGQALPAIARQLGIAFDTARTHLARARAKTGTSSQVELVRTVLTALLPTARPSP
jgi:DNA-binding CsgD family transcriptional regulator